MTAVSSCAHCSRSLDPALRAVCEVCDSSRYCLSCARDHYCTNECERCGCIRGLCVKLIRDGKVATDYGITGSA